MTEIAAIEIDITPEMIEAGEDVLFELEGECSKATLAQAVYRAMLYAAHRQLAPVGPQGQILGR